MDIYIFSFLFIGMSKLLNIERNFKYSSIESIELINLIKIDKIDSSQLTYNDFVWNFMIKNIPVIIKSISNNWACRLQWVATQTASSPKVNFEFLENKIKNITVPVTNCSKEYYNSHQKCEMKFCDYLTYWKNLSSSDSDINKNVNNVLYLKDWHLKENMPNYEFYEVPIYFASDWLNEFLIDNNDNDYRFVYMGPQGSW